MSIIARSEGLPTPTFDDTFQLRIKLSAMLTVSDPDIHIDARINAFLLLNNLGKGGSDTARDPAGDCVFCQHHQHHVPHTERHIREGKMSISMWFNAVEDERNEPRQDIRMRHYLLRSVEKENNGGA